MANNNNTSNLQQMLADNLKQITDLSLSVAKPLMDNFTSNFSTISKSVLDNTGTTINIPQFKLQSSDCCTPKNECPPHCIATITRSAMVGERIIVPFVVKNNCNTRKVYRVGVRELKDVDGKLASAQPRLNKASVTLDAGQQERILMGIDLGNFADGKTYTAEIVLREKDYNQNICFILNVGDNDGLMVAPLDEKKYRLRWQSWKDHFYCEPQKKQPNPDPVTG